MATVDLEKLRRLLAERGLSPEAAARKAGLGPTALKDILSGRVKSPRGVTTEAVAAVLGVTEQELMLPSSSRPPQANPPARVPVTMTPVSGTVEAGAWREVDVFEFDDEPEYIPVPNINQNGGKQAAFRIVGDSMDLAGLSDGAYALTTDWIDGGFEMADGMYVVVERLDGHRREWTVKELRIFADRFELHPNSSNPRHKPIVVKDGGHDEMGFEVRILALVHSTWRALPSRGSRLRSPH